MENSEHTTTIVFLQDDLKDDLYNSSLNGIAKQNADSQAAKSSRKVQCKLCSREISSFYNLRRHLKSRHPVFFHSKVKPVTKPQKKHQCGICEKSYANKWGVTRHKMEVHKIMTLQQACDAQEYTCDICDKGFKNITYLKNHKQRVHKILTHRKIQLKCSECQSSLPTKNQFIEHLRNTHGFQVKIVNEEFQNIEDLEQWKRVTEEETASKYKVSRSYRTKSGLETMSYVCHRNGPFISKSKGIRHKKSKKSNFFCPGSMLVQAQQADKLFPVKVKYVPFHLGHGPLQRRPTPLKQRGLKQEKGDLVISEESDQEPMESEIYSPSNHDSIGETEEAHPSNTEICPQNENQNLPGFEEFGTEGSLNSLQQEAENAVHEFLENMEHFNSDEQLTEICKTMSTLTKKCEALNKNRVPLENVLEKQRTDTSIMLYNTTLNSKDILITDILQMENFPSY